LRIIRLGQLFTLINTLSIFCRSG